MKSLQNHITERLILSKNKKTDDITLSLWVRWYSTPISDNLEILDDKDLDTEHIVSALLGNSNKRLNAQELIDFYDEYKDNFIEDFKEVKVPTTTHPNAADVSFKIGDLKFDYSLTVSFEDFIKKYLEQ
jgi:Leucine-rich repeat (LRR) protein